MTASVRMSARRSASAECLPAFSKIAVNVRPSPSDTSPTEPSRCHVLLLTFTREPVGPFHHLDRAIMSTDHCNLLAA